MAEFRKRMFAPTITDFELLAQEVFDEMPEEIKNNSDLFALNIEDLPDEEVVFELGADSPYSVLSYIEETSKETIGWISASAGRDILCLYRRSILDYWCDSNEDLRDIVKNEMLKGLGAILGLYDDEFDFLDIEEINFSSLKG